MAAVEALSSGGGRLIDVVVGGGIIGAAIARRLAGDEGRPVALVEAGPIGRAASWAAGGILSPIHPWKYPAPLIDLVRASRALWPEFARRLVEESGVEIEYRPDDLLMLFDGTGDAIDDVAGHDAGYGIEVRRLSAAETRRLEPGLGSSFAEALLLSGVGQVRNPRVPRALAIAAARAGAELHPRTSVSRVVVEEGRVTGVETSTGRLAADRVVLATGAWTSLLTRPLGAAIDVRPVKGQMILLDAPGRPLGRMVLRDDHYLIPRSDGRILVGSTVEAGLGFDDRPTAEAVGTLGRVAVELAPALADATFVTAWGGLRPFAPAGLPYLGPVPGIEGLWVAAGHYRIGICLAPITAALIADRMAGRRPAVDPAPFDPGRVGR